MHGQSLLQAKSTQHYQKMAKKVQVNGRVLEILDASFHPDSPSSSPRSLFPPSKTLSKASTTSGDQVEGGKGPLGLRPLYSPPAPEIDFIFVHGRGGHSRKTWSKSSLESHFWPKEWLSKDPAFNKVRIHSYGYDSYYLKDGDGDGMGKERELLLRLCAENMDVELVQVGAGPCQNGSRRVCANKHDILWLVGKEDCLNVHHIGKSLLSAISTWQAARGKELAKTILMWAACAVRPMAIGELDGALTLDIHDSFPRLEESIAALCGQLVVVDKYGRVKMVHETAREFIVAGGLESEFSIEKTKAHTQMAQVCLNYLVGEEMKPPRNSRDRSSANLPATRLDFAAYAYTAYSYHLSRADPLATGLFQLVVQFLRSNVLTWIETIADSQNLNNLIRPSKHLKTYVTMCAGERSPLDPRIRALRQWTTDLARIPAMFANALTVSPLAIYSLIPPFCPTESMVYNTKSSGRRLEVLGASNEQWDDRLLCIDFRQGQPRALSYGDEFLAVGLSSGTVVLYYATSYQEYKVFEHGEAVNFIAFKTKTDLVATCGMKMAKVWDIRSGQMVHSLASPPRPLGMEFDGDTLLIASRNNYITTWNLEHDTWPESTRRPWSDTDTPETNRTPPRRTPCALTLSTGHRMLAVAYSGQPITLWDMREDAYAGSCGKKLPI
ncbi:hypothetical protein HDV63DRAFT_414662 [Trichoderma sp. SZMC 28014]